MLPNQPNHRMDELLKACARQRRADAGAPLEIDPANRNLLQGEVTRTFRRPLTDGSSGPYFLPSFWRRLLLGGSCVALVLVAAGLWLRFDQERELKLAQDRENKLQFFTQSTPEDIVRNREAETRGLSEQMRRFELGRPDRNGGQPAIALAEGEIPRQIEAQPQIQAQVQDRASAAAPLTASNTGRIDLALSTPAADAEMVSNAPRFQFRLPAQPARTSPVLQESLPVLTALPTEATAALGRAKDSVAAKAASPEPGTSSSVSLAMKSSDQGQLGAADVPVAKAPAVEQSAANYGLAATGPAQTSTARPYYSYGSQRQGALYFQQIDPRGKYRQNLNSPPTPKVLTTFEVRQTGQNLQIIDSDGSVYEGLVEPRSQRPPQVLTRGFDAAARPTAGPPLGGVAGPTQRPPQSAPATTPEIAQTAIENETAQPESFAFRAMGTNRTLNQSVVFTGEFEPAPGSVELNQAVAGAVSKGQAVAGRSLQQANELSLARRTGLARSTQAVGSTISAAGASPSSGRIQGQASVGGKNQFRIEAQQAPFPPTNSSEELTR
jgi:hypothetical protein